MDERLDALVQAVIASPKYRFVSPNFVRAVGRRQLARHSSYKSAVKATRNTLHQAGGAFSENNFRSDQALQMLQKAAAADIPNIPGPAFRQASRDIMTWHTSTRERLPILDNFYKCTLASIPPPEVVIDIACGLNPLTRPWMPFGPDTHYLAYDIYRHMTDFLTEAMALAGYSGSATVRDVIDNPPDIPADLALILKALPCLEKVDKAAPGRLMDALPARYLLVSFPAQTLGGRRKGMVAHHEERFRKLLAERGWAAERFEFTTELAFLVDKS